MPTAGSWVGAQFGFRPFAELLDMDLARGSCWYAWSQTVRVPAMLEGSCLCGKVRWRFDAVPDGATACNCTACRRYGALWIYGHDGEDVHVVGATAAYARPGRSTLAFHFCPGCGCTTHWRGLQPEADGRRRLAVNLRLVVDPALVAAIPIDHFDGLDSFDDLPRDGRCVADMWF